MRQQQQQHLQEPSTSVSLTVPQSPHLVKQHSHPLLPSQLASCAPIIVQRQLSQPGQRPTSRVSVHTAHRLPLHSSLDSCVMDRVPSIRVVTAAAQTHSPPPSSDGASLLALPPHLGQSMGSQSKEEGGEVGHHSAATPPLLIVSGPATGSLDYAPVLRVKDELQRSISTPQVSYCIMGGFSPPTATQLRSRALQVPTRELSMDNPRASHCPAIRPGPALGCNFCWNTIDAHGRILRRKTKYHCPECQTNLCIVPCFQEYHERQNQEATAAAAGSSGASNSPSTGSTTNTQPMDTSGRATDKATESAAASKGKLAPFGAISSGGSMNSRALSAESAAESPGTPTSTHQPPDHSRGGGPSQ